MDYYRYEDEQVPQQMRDELRAAVETGLFSPQTAWELKFSSIFETHGVMLYGYNLPVGIYLSAGKTGDVTRYQGSPVQKYCQEERLERYYWAGAYNVPLRVVVALAYRRLRWEANHEFFRDEYLTGLGEEYDKKEIEELKKKADWRWTTQQALDVFDGKVSPREISNY